MQVTFLAEEEFSNVTKFCYATKKGRKKKMKKYRRRRKRKEKKESWRMTEVTCLAEEDFPNVTANGNQII